MELIKGIFINNIMRCKQNEMNGGSWKYKVYCKNRELNEK